MVVIFILILINPNNSATGFEYFLSNDAKFNFIQFSLFYIAINFLNKEVFTLFIKELFRIGFYVLSIKIFYETFMYLIGHGRLLEFFNVKSTIPQSDVLYYTGLYVIILLIKYFFTNKKKYLVLSSVFFIIMILSLRRTEVVSTLFCIISILWYYNKGFLNSKKLAKIGAIIGSFILFMYLFSQLNIFSVEALIERQVSAFSYFNSNLKIILILKIQVIYYRQLLSPNQW